MWAARKFIHNIKRWKGIPGEISHKWRRIEWKSPSFLDSYSNMRDLSWFQSLTFFIQLFSLNFLLSSVSWIDRICIRQKTEPSTKDLRFQCSTAKLRLEEKEIKDAIEWAPDNFYPKASSTSSQKKNVCAIGINSTKNPFSLLSIKQRWTRAFSSTQHQFNSSHSSLIAWLKRSLKFALESASSPLNRNLANNLFKINFCRLNTNVQLMWWNFKPPQIASAYSQIVSLKFNDLYRLMRHTRSDSMKIVHTWNLNPLWADLSLPFNNLSGELRGNRNQSEKSSKGP